MRGLFSPAELNVCLLGDDLSHLKILNVCAFINKPLLFSPRHSGIAISANYLLNHSNFNHLWYKQGRGAFNFACDFLFVYGRNNNVYSEIFAAFIAESTWANNLISEPGVCTINIGACLAKCTVLKSLFKNIVSGAIHVLKLLNVKELH